MAAAKTLNDAYESLQNEANNPDNGEFGVPIIGTAAAKTFQFDLHGETEKIPVKFYDYPGGWLDSGRKAEYQHVIDIVKESRVVMVVISMPYLLAENGRFESEAHIGWIQDVLQKAVANSKQRKLILIVPTKCEAWINDEKRLFSVLEEKCASILNMANGPCGDRLAIAAVPVQTVGNVSFSYFNKEGYGRLFGEVYMKNTDKKFAPQNVDQPLRYAMCFMLNMLYEEKSGNIFTRLWYRKLRKQLTSFMTQCHSGLRREGSKIYANDRWIVGTPDTSTVWREDL